MVVRIIKLPEVFNFAKCVAWGKASISNYVMLTDRLFKPFKP